MFCLRQAANDTRSVRRHRRAVPARARRTVPHQAGAPHGAVPRAEDPGRIARFRRRREGDAGAGVAKVCLRARVR